VATSRQAPARTIAGHQVPRGCVGTALNPAVVVSAAGREDAGSARSAGLNNRRGVAAVAMVGLLGVAGCSGTRRPPSSQSASSGRGFDDRGCGVVAAGGSRWLR